MAAGTASDTDLLRLLSLGHASALDVLVERYQSPLYTLIAFFSESDEAAERVFGEVFVHLLRTTLPPAAPERVDLAFYRIAIDCLNEQREAVVGHRPHSLREFSVHSSKDDPEQRLAASLEEAVHRLPLEYRKVLVLRDMLGLSTEDIEQILFLPKPDVRNRLSRGRKMIRRSLRRSGLLQRDRLGELQLVESEDDPRVGA